MILTNNENLKKWSLRLGLLVIFFLFWPAQFLGEKRQIRLEKFGLEQGLSQSGAMSLLQDRTGFIWIGTQEGLNRYDGYSFKIYRNEPNNKKSLSGIYIRALCEDKDGFIWVGTQDIGLNMYDPKTDTFKVYLHDPNNPNSISSNNIRALCVDHTGRLWIGTQGGGLCWYNKQTDSFIRFLSNPSNPNSLSSDNVTSICENYRGILWIGTTGGGLNRLDIDSGTFINYRQDIRNPNSLCSDNVQAICEDKNGTLFIGTADGLCRYDQVRNNFISYRNNPKDLDSLGNNNVRALLCDRTGHLWIGTSDGLCQYEPERNKFISYKSDFRQIGSLTNNDIRSLYEDRQGLLWIGTVTGGVYQYDKAYEQFAVYRRDSFNSDSLSADTIWTLHEDQEGKLWVGTNDGLCCYDPITNKFIVFKNDPRMDGSLPENSIFAVTVDTKNNVWVGTGSNGICRYDYKTNKFKRYQHDPKDPKSLSSNNILDVYVDGFGVLWIGTRDKGLCRYDSQTDSFITYLHNAQDSSSISVNEIRSIHSGQDGILWVGTNGGGFCQFDRRTEKFITYKNDPNNPESLSNNTVWTLHQDHTGILWIGTNAGLNRFDPQNRTFRIFRAPEIIPNDLVLGILEDSNGVLWISTNKGISKFNPKTNTSHNFDVNDGLQSNEFCSKSCYKSKNGRMFFGGVNGFNAFFPEKITDNLYIPPIVLTGFKKFNQPTKLDISITASKELTINYWENFITFEFAALNFSKSQKNQYAFKLEGFDKDWIKADTQRSATYTNLDGGTYVFRVKGSNNDGVWNEEGVALKVIVIPPPWKRWWAYLAYIIVVGGSIFGGLRFQVSRIRERASVKEIQLRAEAAEIKAQAEANAAEIQKQAAAQLSERNSELDKIVLELKKKNNELIISQKQADRIFSALAEALPGTVLDGKYRLEDKIGTGGFGAVFRGTHMGLNKPIAIKVFKPSPGNDSVSSIERFKLEGVSASRISHQNAIAVLDSGISKEGIAYLVMELLEGRTLADEMQESQKLTLRRCKEIIVPICEALGEAHSLGIIHRDIKPGNIFLHKTPKEGEIVKVVDFGVAKMVGEDSNEDMKSLTATGGIVGTPTYMAPERLKELEYDGRSDVYSVGVMLYEMLCGRAPFLAGSRGFAGIVMGHLMEQPPDMKKFNKDIPEEVEAVIKMALVKDPDKRPTAKEFGELFAATVETYI